MQASRTIASPISKYLVAGLIAGVIAAVIANVWYLMWQVAGGSTYAELGILSITLGSIIPALIGSLLYYGLNSFTKQPTLVFTIIGLIFATLSVVPSFVAPMNPAPGFAAASVPMHYIVALSVLIVVPLLVRQK